MTDIESRAEKMQENWRINHGAREYALGMAATNRT